MATSKKTPITNKKVVKKDGKVIVTYDTKRSSDLVGGYKYPAKVTKIYDNKGNLIKGTRKVMGDYNSSYTERVYDKPLSGSISKVATKALSKVTPKPPVKTPVKAKVTPKVEPKVEPKKETKTTPKVTATTPTKTVAQVWQEKTGTSWADAKKQGLTDGTTKGNMALLAKLKNGTYNAKAATPAVTPAATSSTSTSSSSKGEPAFKSSPNARAYAGSGLGAMERLEGMYKKGGSVKKKSKTIKKKK
jgi:hypothetical protein